VRKGKGREGSLAESFLGISKRKLTNKLWPILRYETNVGGEGHEVNAKNRIGGKKTPG